MKILHITAHLGGGVGTVIIDWLQKDKAHSHQVVSLDYVNEKAKRSGLAFIPSGSIELAIHLADIVVCHYWDHPMLAELFSNPLPDCRMAFWCHKNFNVPARVIQYPDRFFDTSPVQGHGASIWSTGNMERFLAIEPKPHEGFNIGTVVSKKMDIPFVMELFRKIKKAIPGAYFTWLGGFCAIGDSYNNDNFPGKVDDVAPHLAEMDVFAYPLRPDHYGTCEIALGEAMAAGVVPVVMNNPAERLIVRHNVDGLVSKNDNDFILNIQNLSRQMHCNSYFRKRRERAKKLYSIDNMIASWNKVFAEMIQSPKTKREAL